ncbi:hypothetical protein [Phytohabitans aurantiacus]|uniref:Uncharacterized protein n=1 Tax=Phytohabitans aurantiacus TaxID=3016789 RepID=A0ABQ5R2P6_9ACTN|nr:hypothetical protein [Phytohabitans aurantiacus]GLI01054.1 hypothetical protein Pa4123_63300 [Phytohabitans aurantiacus]
MASTEQLIELLRQQGPGGDLTDPRIAPVADLLARREAELNEELARQERELEETQQQARRRERAEALRGHLDALTTELASARALLDDLTAALGACPACCGEDAACRWCRGRGGGGFTTPDPDGFERFVVPAVRMYVRMRTPNNTEEEHRKSVE